MLVAPGTNPGTGGSSGTLVRKASRCVLKSSKHIVFMFLSSFGRTLKSLGPATSPLSWCWFLPLLLLLNLRFFLHGFPQSFHSLLVVSSVFFFILMCLLFSSVFFYVFFLFIVLWTLALGVFLRNYFWNHKSRIYGKEFERSDLQWDEVGDIQ